MAETVPLTIRLPKEHLQRLEALASSTQRSAAALAGEALVAYLEAQEWQAAAITEAVEAADDGARPVEHAAVAAWLRTWGTEGELPRPR